MEKDDELKGSGSSYSTEFRLYDPRIARWLSLDPKAFDHPHQSAYVAFDNNPIIVTDPRGLEGDPKITYKKPERDKKNAKIAEKALKKIAKLAGLDEIKVGRTASSTRDQAINMYNDLENGTPDSYEKPGQKVQELYRSLKKQDKTKLEILDAMEKLIIELGPSTVSKHCADFSKTVTLDIPLGSIPEEKVEAFKNAVKKFEDENIITGFLHPGNNPNENAYHLEFSKPMLDKFNASEVMEKSNSSFVDQYLTKRINYYKSQANESRKLGDDKKAEYWENAAKDTEGLLKLFKSK